MRKRMITPETGVEQSCDSWLDVETVAEVELTSEHPEHSVENALTDTAGSGWQAAQPGPQTIRLIFPTPQDLRRIHLEFRDVGVERTQEFMLRWSPQASSAWTEIVRQRWNFSPAGSTSQTEDLTVELQAVAALELTITPDIDGGDARATLARLRLA